MRWRGGGAQDHEGPFCTMKLGTARVFVPTEYQAPSAGQTRLPGHSPGKATRTKRRNEAYPPDTERFVQRRASFEGLAGIKGLHRSNSSGALAVKPNQRTQIGKEEMKPIHRTLSASSNGGPHLKDWPV